MANRAETRAELAMSNSVVRTVEERRDTENNKRSKNTLSHSSERVFVHPGVLELFAVSQGVIGIKGVYSNRFLAMNKRGRLHATVSIPHKLLLFVTLYPL